MSLSCEKMARSGERKFDLLTCRPIDAKYMELSSKPHYSDNITYKLKHPSRPSESSILLILFLGPVPTPPPRPPPCTSKLIAS